ncbi:MAG TPA: alpha/beta hydrolase [Anaerolineae bacterium]|nr:alpha/beta hydrolase [Anaerolineae bacterium]HIP71759.1 alpha/beta hydrolase [Anaerolineae bacterium]
MPFVTAGKQQIYYELSGEPADKPVLLLVHGAGGSHLDWPEELRHLPDTAVITPDLPGHGRTPPPARSAITAYADDIQAFIEKLRLAQVIVAGHSMGGAIAQELAVRHSPQVVGLVLVGTGAKLRVSPALLEMLETDFVTAVAQVPQYAFAPNAPDSLRRAHQSRLAQNDAAVVYGDFAACDVFDVREQLGQISVPTLVISGSEDVMTPPKYGRYLAEHIPHATFTLIENAGHMMALEQPDELATAVARFMRQNYEV